MKSVIEYPLDFLERSKEAQTGILQQIKDHLNEGFKVKVKEQKFDNYSEFLNFINNNKL